MNADLSEAGRASDPETYEIIGAAMDALPFNTNALFFQKNNLRESA
jgi:hypothetical protein